MIRIGLFLAFAAHAVTATPTFRRDDHWAPHPTGWDEAPEGNTWMAMAPPSHMMEMRIGVMSNNMEGLEKAVYEMSTPGNPKYGMHLSTDEVKAYMAPSTESMNAVTSWITSMGLTYTTSSMGEWVHLTAPVSTVNEMLRTNYSMYMHEASGQTMMRTLNYSLPADVAGHVKAVYPTTSFDMIMPHAGAPIPMAASSVPDTPLKRRDAIVPTDTSCTTTITPSCLAELYGIPTKPTPKTTNSVAVLGLIRQFAQQSDLNLFLRQNRRDLSPNTTFRVTSVANGLNPQGPGQAGDEANLDIQYTVGLLNGIDVNFVTVGGTGGGASLLDLTQALQTITPRPTVLSISYGLNELGLTSSLANSICQGFMALGALGVSVVSASGDDGVSGTRAGVQTCKNTRKFGAIFPSSCPFVTSVGATVLEAGNKEVAVSRFPSGGGFSNVAGVQFATPSYQLPEVKGFLTVQGNVNAGFFNPAGRGFPDIAAIGDRAAIVNDTKAGHIGGTSLSTPIVASIIGLVNDRLIAANLPPLGFLNPFIYANRAVFTDIIQGNNPGCGTTGFKTASGWDPVTGLGTPKFDALLAAAFSAHGTQPPKNTTSPPPGSNNPSQFDTGAGISTLSQPVIGDLRLDAFIGIAVGIFVLIVAIIAGIILCRRRSRKTKAGMSGSVMLGYGPAGYRPLSDPAPDVSGIIHDRGDRVSLLSSSNPFRGPSASYSDVHYPNPHATSQHPNPYNRQLRMANR